MVQKACAGTESKSETEKLLRQAMEDYESKKFIAKVDNVHDEIIAHATREAKQESAKLLDKVVGMN